MRCSPTDRRSSQEVMQNDPSRIWIRTQKLNDRYIAIFIKDNGNGIPTQIHNQIFNELWGFKSPAR
ncbi:two-component sensor histidine kinase [Nostoc commune NIES-4072]|uniref:Two-component sensor histidine kinase n=1 Tax=Nostoc commune NIES-4072 TaxID=2005467 RepID=A0A2R5FWD9_NOSCO|nr:ATP-binding protein [Nostoc commune]BBD69025.1 two-component sensor histidine kinase [Nostoc commune HK-02]GBG19974.1 two-component sensor histidine kinase [Nostoc commune NIES-4072]